MNLRTLVAGLVVSASVLVTGCAGRTAYRPTCCPTPALVRAAPVGVAPAPCCNGAAPVAIPGAVPAPPPPPPAAVGPF